MKKIAILGSTGSIGTQALDVIERQKDSFSVEVLTAGSNVELLAAQAIKFNPNSVVISDESKYKKLCEMLAKTDIKVYAGIKAIEQIVESGEIDIVLTAMVGYAGLLPTINAIKYGKTIALANKETLVVAGEIITKAALENKVPIIPVDSEHSAIFQCLTGEFLNPVEKIFLTASGGPFRGKTKEFIQNAQKEQALKHPNWDMGNKITIDSATLMNKGLEAIEAKWLFSLKAEQIEVVVHPQSIIHSAVQFEDGSIKAQMGLPDMRLPILYALSFPKRLKSDFERFDFFKFANLTFEKPQTDNFPCLRIAFDSMKAGGNTPCVMNAANEAAVAKFLSDKIRFSRIPEIIEKTIEKISFISNPCIEDLILSNKEAYEYANSL